MSTSSEKFCSPEDVEKKNSERTTNKKEDLQKDKKKTLQCVRTLKICAKDLKNWPILNLLKLEFISQIHTVMVYGNSGNRAIIVTKDKNVYSLGCNKDNHLKTGDDIHTALYPKRIEELCGKNIKTFSYSYYFMLALTEEGEVYIWEFKKQVSSIKSSLTSTPTRVLNEKHIIDIACGTNHYLALTSDGKVYAWGENNYGQIGNGHTTCGTSAIEFSSVPQQVIIGLEKENVIHIACGSSFNVVTTNKKLYSWGNNNNGQISIQSQNDYAYPYEIINIIISDKIVKVACGYDHTLVLTVKGKIYAWGNNSYGQVGINNIMKSSGVTMVNMSEMGEVLDIAARGNLSVALGCDRIIYVWGDCFGHCITTPFRTTFSTIHDPFAYHSCRGMHKPLTVFSNNEYEELNILKSLEAAFDDPTTSDFTIQVEGQPIHVHKSILKIRCQYFQNMFQHGWVEDDQSVSSAVYTTSDKFSYIVYKAFLKYLYAATIDLPLENVLELMELADMYCETNLKKDCSQIIKQAISVSNFASFYNKAIEYNAKELEEFCLQFAFRHLKAVVLSEDFTKLDFNTVVNFIRKAAKKNIFKT